MNCAVVVMGGSVQRVHFEIFSRRSVYDVVLCAGGDHDRATVADYIRCAIDNALPFSALEAKKLIVVWVRLHPYFFVWLEAHQDKLTVFSGV